MLYNYIKKREERQKIKVFAVKSNFSTKKLQKNTCNDPPKCYIIYIKERNKTI
jgi:hypothetical protein